jgi:hypothetical protein
MTPIVPRGRWGAFCTGGRLRGPRCTVEMGRVGNGSTLWPWRAQQDPLRGQQRLHWVIGRAGTRSCQTAELNRERRGSHLGTQPLPWTRIGSEPATSRYPTVIKEPAAVGV